MNTLLTQAFWIWPEPGCWDLRNCYSLFRKDFTLESVPEKAPLLITADQSYHLYVNGHYAGRGPARGFQKSWPYDEIDLVPWLQPGRNVIAVRAYNPGFGNFVYIHRDFAGFIAAADFGSFQLLTDGTWKCRRQSGVDRNNVPTSQQLFPQESIDLRVEDPNWMQPDYAEDDTWELPSPPRAWNALPWENLEPRDIPFLDESFVPLAPVIGRAEGISSANHLHTRNLATNRYEEGLAHEPFSTTDLQFPPRETGQWSSILIDLGKLHVGCVELVIPEALGGEIIETAHYETVTIDPSGTITPDYLPKAWCRMAFSNRLICRPGRNIHTFFHHYGFRYMVLTVRDNPAALTVKARLRQYRYPLQEKGHFSSSDSMLNRIWQTCAWTQRMCSLDAFVDTPWREQAQWWGDARVQAWNTFYLDGDARLFARGIRQIGSQTTEDGVTYGHAPTIAHNCVLPDFNLIWILTLWDYYWQTGSLTLFLDHQETIDRSLAYFEKWTDPDTGLLHYDHRFWLFLDWNDIQKEGSSTVYNLWLLIVLGRLADLHTLAGHTALAEERRAWATRVRTSIRRLLNEEGLLRDGILPEGGVNPETSLHSQTLAIMGNLAPEHETVMLDSLLLPFLRGDKEPRNMPSAYWITYIYSLLSERGHGDLVVGHIRKNWAKMAEHGTTWENWQPLIASESHSHAWSAHPLFHLMQAIGGIRQHAAAWKAVTFSPTFEGDHADVTVPTPAGPIRSRWKRDGGIVNGELHFPAGIEVFLPGSATPLTHSPYVYSNTPVA